jgi:hypothetical protein
MMASANTHADFVNIIAEEIVSGIDNAVEYWLGRIEQELSDHTLTTLDRLQAIQRVLLEYESKTGRARLARASA